MDLRGRDLGLSAADRVGATLTVMDARKPLILPWWAWVIVALLWFEVENEHRLRLIYYRIRSWLD
jgi:hypothetical protein